MISKSSSEIPNDDVVTIYKHKASMVMSIPKKIISQLSWSVGDLILFTKVGLYGERLFLLSRVDYRIDGLKAYIRPIRIHRYTYIVTIPSKIRYEFPQDIKLTIIGDNALLVSPEDFPLEEDVSESKRIYRPWTEKEIEFLKKYYPHMSNRDLSIILNRTEYSIKSKAIELGLRKHHASFPKHLKKLIKEIKKNME